MTQITKTEPPAHNQISESIWIKCLYYSHFTNEEVEAQGSEVIGLKSQNSDGEARLLDVSLTPLIPGVRISQEVKHQEWGWRVTGPAALPWVLAGSPALGNQ